MRDVGRRNGLSEKGKQKVHVNELCAGQSPTNIPKSSVL
jgi:hypothetical protein